MLFFLLTIQVSHFFATPKNIQYHKMKSFQQTILPIALLTLSGCNAFTTPSLLPSATTTRAGPLHAYVPDGLTPEQYQTIRANDKKNLGKDLGRLGPRGFRSRSMQAWQEAYERGETGHAFAPFGYRQQLQEGKLSKKDVPYMVRGGSWDNSDVKGARRLKWLKTDREYAKGGYKKEQSASILGSGPGFNWTGEKREKNTKWLVPGLS